MKIIDANIVLHYFVQDGTEKTRACIELVKKIKAGTEKVYLPDEFVADIIYVLEGKFKTPRKDVKAAMVSLISLKGMSVFDGNVLLAALDIYAETKIDWADSLAAVHMSDLGIPTIYSYDKHFDKIDGITRIEP